jgi:Domain of unknown function (DUF3463)
MTETNWDAYGTGNYEKCAQCMVQSRYEATVVMDTLKHPLKALGVAFKSVRTEGENGQGDSARPAAPQYMFSRQVEERLKKAS